MCPCLLYRDVDEYSGIDCEDQAPIWKDHPVDVFMHIEGAPGMIVSQRCEHGIVLVDKDDKYVDIYEAEYGTLNKPSGGVIGTLFSPGA
jgi:hypothetical protein